MHHAGGPKREKDATDADAEEGLLEARRRRLLQQGDWAGLTRPKPVSMHFQSSEEKDKIGKRRKIKDHRAATTLQSTRHRLVPRLARDEGSNHPGLYMRGALQNEDIRIRIGTDALANLTPTQRPSAGSRSLGVGVSRDESSDTMLFDNEDLHTAQGQRVQPAPSDDQNPRVFVGVHSRARAAFRRLRGEPTVRSIPPDGEGEVERCLGERNEGEGAGHDCTHYKPSQENTSFGQSSQENDAISGCYITQRIGGVIGPLRLVFNHTSEPQPEIEDAQASDGNATVDTIRAHDSANARPRGKGSGKKHPDFSGAFAHPSGIVDDGPWRSLLPISDNGSSHSSAFDLSLIDKTDTHQHRKPSRDRDSEPTPWSQHATQGEPTCITSSSCVSASLPSITRDSETSATRTRMHNEGKRGRSLAKKDQDESEKLWRRMVFGSDNAPASDTTHDEYGEEQERKSETLIPSSIAVASLSSTPFQSVSGLTSRASDSVRDAASRALLQTSPGSMPPLITSPLPRRNAVGPLQGSREGEESNKALQTAEFSGFGEMSVTHTSLLNNVSYDVDASPSRTSGDLRAFHDGLERRYGCRNDRFGRVQARSEHPSIYEIPVSSEHGLDLVDPDRI